MRQWRLIYDQPTNGPRNMAVDEAIMQAVIHGVAPPTLRLYDWFPACLSLGYGQKETDADLQRITARGWDVVRRPTGGRAILHIDELTYSVALPLDHPLAAGGIVDSYRRLSEAFAHGLTELGTRPHAERRTERNTDRSPVCFDTPSHYEITVDGRKLVGSAQMRRKNALLQHGTLPLTGDVGRICDALSFSSREVRERAKTAVRKKATTLSDALGEPVTWEEAAEAVVNGFRSALDITFVEGELSEWENETADRLVYEVYSVLDRPKRRD